jgi:DNA replication and repair protein RecF
MRAPRLAGVRSDYDRILKQRNSLLKTAGAARRGSSSQDSALSTLGVWDAHLARTGAEVLAERLRLVDLLRPYVGHAYATVARGASVDDAGLDYQASLDLEGATERADLTERLLAELERRRGDELDRGISLVGPHRDELVLSLGNGERRLPVRGYASHGESWSFALALRLASYDLLRADGDDPILILDDVFAELDSERRSQLAELVAGAEQVLVTAAVADDVPEKLAGTRFVVGGGDVRREL